MAVKRWNNLRIQYVDTVAVGNPPLNGGRLFFYSAGTSTKLATYTDSTGATPNSNPIVLNSAGEPSTEIWLQVGQMYKIGLAIAGIDDPPASFLWTEDNISPINDVTVTQQGQWLAFAGTPTFISATSFSVIGDQRQIFDVGRRTQTTNTGGTTYSRVTASAFALGVTTVTVVNDSGGVIDSGISAVNYGILSGANQSVPALNPLIATVFNAGFPPLCNGRLTLTTGVPVTTSDVLAATTVYFSPYAGNSIGLFDGVNWGALTFSELSIAVPAGTSQMYDVFAFNNSGVVALELLAWTNDTTRATALVLQNGVLVKSGATTRRYLGSFRTITVSGQTEDSLAKRYVWNYSNRVPRKMLVTEAAATWTYTIATFRQANANAANQLDMVIGVSETPVKASVVTSAGNSSAGVHALVGIGIDSATVNSADLYPLTGSIAANQPALITAQYAGFPGIGRHFLAWLEISTATATTTWNGLNTGSLTISKSGISGEIAG